MSIYYSIYIIYIYIVGRAEPSSYWSCLGDGFLVRPVPFARVPLSTGVFDERLVANAARLQVLRLIFIHVTPNILEMMVAGALAGPSRWLSRIPLSCASTLGMANKRRCSTSLASRGAPAKFLRQRLKYCSFAGKLLGSFNRPRLS